MSIDLDVIPRSSTLFKWGELKAMILQCALSDEATHLLGGVVGLREQPSKRSLNDNEIVECPGYYYFELARDCTLSLKMNEVDAEYEPAFLDDCARNLTHTGKEILMQQWLVAGFSSSICTFGGRARGELELFAKIACFVAELTNGMIVVMDNHLFNISVGIYSAEEFSEKCDLYWRAAQQPM